MPPRPRLIPPAPLARAFLSRFVPPPPGAPPRDRDQTHGSVSPSPPPPPTPPPPPPFSDPPLSPDPLQIIISGEVPAHSTAPPTPQVPFSTQAFLRKLERRSGGTIGRGVAAVVTEATRDMLWEQERRVGSEAWRKGDLENEAYLYTAALAELKTSSQVKSRNDSTLLRSMTASLQRETDAIEQRLKEDVHRLRSDIQLDMNNRKEEVNADLKGLDRAIMDLNSKFTILLGEARTEIETVRWVSTRRVMTTLVILVVGVVAGLSLPSPANDASAEQNAAPTVEELGVRRTEGTEADATGGRGWFWSGGRVEGEGEEEGGVEVK